MSRKLTADELKPTPKERLVHNRPYVRPLEPHEQRAADIEAAQAAAAQSAAKAPAPKPRKAEKDDAADEG